MEYNKPKVLIWTASPEGVSTYLKEKFVDWDIVVVDTTSLDKLQGEVFKYFWVDEMVKYTPSIYGTHIDKPKKSSKIHNKKHTIPFWCNDYRRNKHVN